MGTSVDNRIVRMQFDNKQFESGCKTTLGTLEKLHQSLNFNGAKDSLKNLASSVNNFSFNAMATGLNALNSKFSALGVAGMTVIQDITRAAENAGKTIVSALTIDPVKTGFEEYETQINAVQTILANTQSKGTTIDQVNDALDELNHYADKTIYNFTEMTRNIGTFTAAGIDLDTSVTAIQGIANLAAVSGSTSNQASVAMYQLSQALAAGTVKLQDWNSVVNAGMGGQVFQDTLKETAREMGIAVDDMIEKQGSFRESLSEGWLTSEVLTKTLAKFTDESTELGRTATDAATKVKTFTQLWDTMKEAVQSGWTETWEMVIGDFEEAKETLTQVNNFFDAIIQNYNEARNSQIKLWRDAGGREKLIKSFKNALEGIKSVLIPVQKVMSEFIPKFTADRLIAFTSSLVDLTAKLKLSKDGSLKLENVLRGLFSIVNIGGSIVSSIVKIISPLVIQVLPKVMTILSSIGESVTALTSKLRENNVITELTTSTFEILVNAFTGAIRIINAIATSFKSIVPNKTIKMVTNLTKKITTLTKRLSKIVDAGMLFDIQLAMNVLAEATALVVDVFDSMIASIDMNDSAIEVLIKSVLDLVGSLSRVVSEDILVIRKSGILQAIIKVVCKALSVAIGIVADAVKAVSDISIKILSFIRTNETAQKVLKATKTLLKTVLTTILNFKDSIVETLKAIKESEGVQNLIKQLQDLWEAFSPLVSSKIEKATENLNNFVLAGSESASFTNFVALVSSLANGLSSILKTIASGGNPFEKISEGFKTGKLKPLYELKSLYTWFLNFQKRGLIKTALQEINIAIDSFFSSDWVDDISDSFANFFGKIGESMSNVDWSKLLKTVNSVVTGLAVVRTLTSVKKSVDELTKIFSNFNAIGANLNTLFKSWTNVAKTAQTALRAKIFESISLGVAALAASLWIIAQIPKDRLEDSVKTLTLVFTELVAACALLSSKFFDEKKLTALGVSFAGLGIGMLALMGAIKVISLFDQNTFSTGMQRLLGLLVEMAIASRLAGKQSKTAAAIMALGVAINLLVPPLLILGSVSKGTAIQGALTVVSVMEALGIAIRLAGKGAKSAMAFLAMAVAVDTIVPAIVLIGNLDRNTALQGAAVVVGVIEALAVGARIAGNSSKSIKGMAGVILEIVSITAALYILQNIDQAQLITAASCISGVVLAISGASRLAKASAGNTATIGVMITEVVGAFAAMSLIGDSEELIKIAESMVSVLIVLTGVTAILSKAKLSMSAAATGIVSIAEVIGGFGLIIAALAGLKMLLDQIGDTMGFMQQGMEMLKMIGQGIGDFIGAIMGGIAEGAMEGFGKGLESIGANLTNFWNNASGFFDGIKTLQGSGMLEGIRILTAAMMSLFGAEFVNFLMNNPLTKLLTGSQNPLELLMSSMEVMLNGEDGKGGFNNFVKECSKLDADSISKAKEAANGLSAIATAASKIPNEGGLIGAIAGENNIAEFVSHLPAAGEQLVLYAGTVRMLDDDMIKKSKAGMDMLTYICKAAKQIPNTGGWLATWIGDNEIGQFVRQLPSVGRHLVIYGENVSGLTDSQIKTSKSAMKMLNYISKAAANIPNTGGWLATWIGDNSIGKFVGMLPDVGINFKKYANTVGVITKDKLTKSNDVMASLTKIISAASDLPSTGGVVQWWTGDNNLEAFAENLKDFAEDFIAYLSYIGDNLPDNYVNLIYKSNMIAYAATTMSELSDKLTSLGDERISLFGANVEDFGESMVSYLATIGDGFNPSWMQGHWSAIKIGESINELSQNVTKIGDTRIGVFGENIADFGSGIKAYYDDVKGISSSTVDASLASCKRMIADISTMKSIAPDMTEFKDFGYQLKIFGSRFKSFYEDIIAVTESEVSEASNSLNHIISSFKLMKEVDTTVVNDFGNTLKKIASNGIDNFVTAFDESDTKVDDAVKTFVNMARDVANRNTTILYNAFYTLGGYASEGFENGLTSRLDFVRSSAESIANEALSAAQLALDSHSPSRETIKLGEYFSQGMAIGISNLGDVVEESGFSIADKAKTALAESMQTISDIANGYLALDLTITPVMDLSSVYSGAKTAYGVVNGTSIAMSRMAGAKFNTMIDYDNKFDDSNIVDSIHELQNEIQTLSDTMSRTQIVMDSGAMVGQLAKPMNNEINRLNVFKRRHN